MRIALATCRDLPQGGADDRFLHAALERRGVTLCHPPWDDPGFDWAGCDACLIRTTWYYMERRDEYVAWAERVASLTPLFNGFEVVRWNTHKSYLRELAERGFPVVPTRRFETGSAVDLGAAMAELGWSQGLLKPAVGATSRETLRFGPARQELAEAQRHLERTLAREDMLLQPYLATVETRGELSAILIEGTITHVVRKVPLGGDFRTQEEFGARDELVAEPDATLADLGRELVASLGAELLYARADFLEDEAGTLLLSELELVEPGLFFRHRPEAAELLAEALLRRVGDPPRDPAPR